jgi:NAD(P) transhydrogenase subunit alpha
LLGEDASELYAKNQYNLLVLMVKNNVVTIDWADEILARTVLTHAGELKAEDKTTAARAPPTPRAKKATAHHLAHDGGTPPSGAAR